jgi:hypothetical protein
MGCFRHYSFFRIPLNVLVRTSGGEYPRLGVTGIEELSEPINAERLIKTSRIETFKN